MSNRRLDSTSNTTQSHTRRLQTRLTVHTSEVEVDRVVEEAAAPDAGEQARYGHERHGDDVREAGDGGEPLAVALPAVDAASPDVNAHHVLRGSHQGVRYSHFLGDEQCSRIVGGQNRNSTCLLTSL